jgi:hypothetical protein
VDLALFAELKRRRVFRALGGYGIAAFSVLQIIEPIMHGLHCPTWCSRTSWSRSRPASRWWSRSA